MFRQTLAFIKELSRILKLITAFITLLDFKITTQLICFLKSVPILCALYILPRQKKKNYITNLYQFNIYVK